MTINLNLILQIENFFFFKEKDSYTIFNNMGMSDQESTKLSTLKDKLKRAYSILC